MARRVQSVEQRFWRRVQRGGPDDCWPWLGGIPAGYGVFHIGAEQIPAHRFAYELLIGPIPEGLTLDHLCLNRDCVNPAHLEPVTRDENSRRAGFARWHLIAAMTRLARVQAKKVHPIVPDIEAWARATGRLQ